MDHVRQLSDGGWASGGILKGGRKDNGIDSRVLCMKEWMKFLAGIGAVALLLGFVVDRIERRKEKKDAGTTDAAVGGCRSQKEGKAEQHCSYGIYERYLKRPLDFAIALLALVFLWPVYLILLVLVRMKLGEPVIFIQERPGKDEKIFKLYKFRTMTDARDEKGELLPDEVRLTEFGKRLRASSLDELPELFNILKGDMSFVGPRPLLVEYLSRYSERQARRHEVRPGLTGLAQVHGRNAISWEEKFELDVRYVGKVSFLGDMKIILETVAAVIKREGINSETAATMEKFNG